MTDEAKALAFFFEQASHLASQAVGDAHAFMLIYNAAAIRRRNNAHVHVFVVQRRWQKAWLYILLAGKNIWQALRAYWS